MDISSLKISLNLRNPNFTNNGEEAGKGPGLTGSVSLYVISLTILLWRT